MRVHVVGASGSGTTTLGRALAGRLAVPHHDTDDFFWLPSEPQFQHLRERGERQAMLGAALARTPGWVLSGSLCGWGDQFITLFLHGILTILLTAIVVFLSLHQTLTTKRLLAVPASAERIDFIMIRARHM